MKPWLVLPVKSLAGGKSRLAAHLDADARRALNAELLDRSLALASRYPGLAHTLVVSRCSEVLATARARGATCLHEEGCGLNAAVEQAVRYLHGRNAGRILVLSCDLPLASEADLRALAAHDNGVVLATDRAGSGTNALCLPAAVPFRFHYGPSSGQLHAREVARHGLPCRLIERPGLAFDLDTVADWREWRTGPIPAAA